MIKNISMLASRYIETISSFLSISREERRAKKFFNKECNWSVNTANSIIYIDSLQTPNTIVALSYFLPQLRLKYHAQCVAYRHIEKKFYNSLTNKFRFRFSVLRTLGMVSIQIFAHSSEITKEIRHEFSLITTKKDLENYIYHGIYIGDLIYDSYLNELRLPTVDLMDPNLLKIFARCIETVNYWEEKIQNENIGALCVNHTVYSSGIPARVALYNNIDVFQVTTESLYRMSNKRNLAHLDYFEYPEKFRDYTLEFQHSAKELASKGMKSRISGELTSDLFYMPKSAFSEISGNEKRVLKETNNPKILIATHDFYDSPHCYGNSLFPDFFEWLNVLGELSNETNIDWYLKNHPFLRGNGMEVINVFLERFPNIILIDPNVSHNQLINEGISAVTTVFGSIALEYAYLGLQVINACPTNPHFRYDFSASPKNKNEYIEKILNIEKTAPSGNLDEILEFYYMHYLDYPQNWVFDNYDYYLSSTVGEGRKSLLKTYKHYLESNNTRSRCTINESIEKFLEGQSYRLKILE